MRENNIESLSAPRTLSPDTIDRARAAFRSISLRDLMWSLHDQNSTIAEAAAEELHARGLSDTEIEIARRLTSPNAAQRKRLVDDLPSIRGTNGRPWLFWLAEDEEADVRLAALAMLATTNDPSTKRRVAEIASRDGDPRIVRLAERLTRYSQDSARK